MIYCNAKNMHIPLNKIHDTLLQHTEAYFKSLWPRLNNFYRPIPAIKVYYTINYKNIGIHRAYIYNCTSLC